MYDIIINNVFATQHNLHIVNRVNIPVSQKEIETISIAGRNGTLTKELGFLDRSITVNFNFKTRNRNDNMSKKIRNITSLLLNAKKISFTDDKEVYYKVKAVSVSDIERTLRMLGSFSVTFTVDPFAYYNLHSKITIASHSKIYNIGTYESEPYIKVFGSGNVTLNINNKELTLKDVNEYIEIDSELKETLKDNVSKNDKKVGEYPKFLIGENTISWSGNITKIEIEPRWRFL
ncbi:distal tail protein Dit [uncultured Clostridium sp.]|uniref:distal tail protein Dit n=1 Tax=uncultured Clostridium sp. TaxID=59620 RepID=UPI0025F175BF|nr:distal tail protein Dit [uncultured Clostridium sp.]